MDMLSRADDAKDRPIEKLTKFDVDDLNCEQMQALYLQMVAHQRSRLGVHKVPCLPMPPQYTMGGMSCMSMGCRQLRPEFAKLDRFIDGITGCS